MALAEGLDELRVDWLLGDPTWGARIGEITYEGAAFSQTPELADFVYKVYMRGLEDACINAS